MKHAQPKPKLLAIIGPTASGKTDLAIALAKKFKGEIISADSRQFYRGTDIGSDIIAGKWVKLGRRRVYVAQGVPHHLIAFRPVNRPVTAAEFQALAVRQAKEIIKRGRLPILCGGTGLFVSAVTDNFQIPDVPPDPEFRERLGRRRTETLFRELKRKDPDYAARIQPQNRRYIIRALEVMSVSGQPASRLQGKGEPVFDVLKIGIQRPRPQIHSRISLRVDLQLERGLLKEAAKLGRRYGWDWPAMSGLGHRQLGLYIRGEASLEEAVRLIKRDTRRYARRQLTWWRRDGSVQWVKGAPQAVKLTARFLKKKG